MSGFSDQELGMEVGFRVLEDFLQDDDFIVDSDECSLNCEVDVEGDDDDFFSSVPLFLDSLQLADGPDLEDLSDEVTVEWEEIKGCIDEGEVLSMIFNVDDNGGNSPDIELDVVDFDGNINDGDDVVDLEVVGNLGWEVLYEMGFNPSLDDEAVGLPLFIDDVDDFYAAEYEPLFGRSDNNFSGVRPASKSAMDELASTSVVCSREEDRICAICKDGLSVGEEVTKMPCDHVHHSDCIFTWLRIQNTCPICRIELPTEDDNCHREGTMAVDVELF